MKSLFREIIVDNFAGGGGASTGIELATGRSVDVAINHDPDAIAMHKTNHPTTEHYCESVWDVDPVEVARGRPVALVWLSPDCKHFSKAKGGKPVEKSIRGLAWVGVKWGKTVKPRVIALENVEEFQTWGPLIVDENGNHKPCPARKGQTFEGFVLALSTGLSPKHPAYQECITTLDIQWDVKERLKIYKGLGYTVDWRELRACDFGAPTIRKRLFLIARRDGQPITWPKPTHGEPNSLPVKKGKILAWRTAAECIDWDLPCPSIFDRKRPLAENTMKRIARGIQKFVIDNPEPFIVKCNHTSTKTDYDCFRGQGINDPLQTITAAPGFALVAPFITEHANASNQRNMPSNEPLRTQCAQVKGGHFAMVTGHLCKHYGGNYNGAGAGADEPMPTVTSVDHNALVTSHLIKMKGQNTGQRTDTPLHTITAGGNHIGEVRAFLLKYYGNERDGYMPTEPLHTIPTKDRFGLVTVHGHEYQIADIGMRMLQPHELFKAQGFPDGYIIDHDYTGKRYPKTKQVARCGNAVPPPFAEHLVKANMPELCRGGEFYDAVTPRWAS